MLNDISPKLSEEEVSLYFEKANNSIRHREPKILHQKGDYLNRVFNFILSDSYMHPHMHPSEEKIEKMYLIEGSFALTLFDDFGGLTDVIILEEGQCEEVQVPAFTWHTYIMLSDRVIIYETMEGFYNPNTWKNLAPWAPDEGTVEAIQYLNDLKVSIKDFNHD